MWFLNKTEPRNKTEEEEEDRCLFFFLFFSSHFPFFLSRCCAPFVCDASFCQWNPGSFQLSLGRVPARGRRGKNLSRCTNSACFLVVQLRSINHIGHDKRSKLWERPAATKTAQEHFKVESWSLKKKKEKNWSRLSLALEWRSTFCLSTRVGQVLVEQKESLRRKRRSRRDRPVARN